MSNSLHQTAGTFFVKRKSAIAQFSFGEKSSSFPTRDAALQAAISFKSAHRRSARCSIIECAPTGQLLHEVVAATEAEPEKGSSPKASTATREPKTGDRKERRKERREKRKHNIIELRALIQNSPMKVIGVNATESDDSVIRRESFKEVHARVCRQKALRITTWKHSKKQVVTGLGVAAFR